jgi:phosphopantetheinyl transferase (holo-ACP synthase)
MGIGIDFIEVSMLAETPSRSESLSKLINEMFSEHLAPDATLLATWLAVNEAVFKSLDPYSQIFFCGINYRSIESPKISFIVPKGGKNHLRCLRSQVSVSHHGDFVIAVAVSKISFFGHIFRFLTAGKSRYKN